MATPKLRIRPARELPSAMAAPSSSAAVTNHNPGITMLASTYRTPENKLSSSKSSENRLM